MNIKNILGKAKRKSPYVARFEKIETDLQKIDAQLEAVKQMRKSESEIITSTGEQLGEVRGVLSDKEKEIRELKLAVSKSVELVNAAKPDKLMIEAEKQNVKIETLKGKLDVYKGVSDKIMKELKSLRKDMEVFRGVKQVIKMVEEVRSDINIVKTIKSTVERDADKDQKMFIKIQEVHTDFTKYKKSAEDMQNQFRDLLKEFDELKISLGKPPGKETMLKRFMKLRF